jgi:hypothetical protein
MTSTQDRAVESPAINEAFGVPADEAALDRAATALRARGFDARVVDDLGEAKELVLSLVPEGAEVAQGASVTLEQIGVTDTIERSGRYEAIRPTIRAMDRATQMRQIRRLGAAPDIQLNSVQAVTEDGQILVVSAGGSQLGPIAFGAGRVVLVVGAQKVVPDLATAFRRVDEYSLPLENERAMKAYGRNSAANKLLVMRGDAPGRTTVLLLREAIGA